MVKPKKEIEKLKEHQHLEYKDAEKLYKYIDSLETALKKKHVKRGKWVSERGLPAKVEYDADGNLTPVDAYCKYCGTWLVCSDVYPVHGNFCPVCGAAMNEYKAGEED